MPALLFALTLATSAALLFAVQPMVARMALPVLGGSPAVWNTSMVFFQAAVLAGYGLAHALATRVGARWQLVVFGLLVALGAMVQPVRFAATDEPPTDSPVGWLLVRLLVAVGLPALALGTASPLLQRWFIRARSDAREPYFLYAASNVGSLGALLAYPVWLEPWLPLDQQASWWAVGYAGWALLLLGCAAVMLSRSVPVPGVVASGVNVGASTGNGTAAGRTGGSSWREVAVWVGLGAVPASLLQGCTLFLTTDVASIPLLWVVPLAAYLLTFVVAFDPRGVAAVPSANRVLPFVAAGLLYAILSRATEPVVMLIALHLGFLLVAGLVCHGRLVALRPDPSRLTGFYLAMSVGGVIGGGFNALVAPRLFTGVTEYPLAIALACAALPRRARARAESTGGSWLTDMGVAAGLGLAMVILALVLDRFLDGNPRLRDALAFGLPAIGCCTLLDRPRRLVLSLLVAFLVGLWWQDAWAGNRWAERNFFGITRVTQDAEGRFNQIFHGNTIHGRQALDPARRREPLSYYHREGPVGWIFDEFRARWANPENRRGAIPSPVTGLLPGPRIGVIGLGIGALTSYAEAGDDWTFFEIDPAVIRVARDTNWFTFLADCRAGEPRIVTGDARLRLVREADGTYDLLILDAFSSDAIPVHLLTREALAVYLRKLRPHGWLAAHISNRYLKLAPVFAALAKDAGIACRSAEDDNDRAFGKEPSHWMLLARRLSDLGRLPQQVLWPEATGAERVPLWTDQQAAVLPLFEWR